MTEKVKPLDRKAAICLLWNKGIISYKLDEVQKELYRSLQETVHKTVVWSCSRRLGKSFTLCIIAMEKCLQKPNSIVKYIAPSQKHVKMIIRPLLKEIMKDCPKELRPTFRTADNVYRFPNGSEIQLAGTDNGHAESLRGGSSDLCIVDEAGFCDDLRYIVRSILIPTTTTTRGKIVLSSTPPKSSDHEFMKYVEEAEFRGTHIKKTIYDNPRLTPEMIQEIIDELGGPNSIEFRREYLCQYIKDENSSVVPEFDEELKKAIIKEVPPPVFRDLYVAGDIGFKDLTVFLFGYYDFKANKIVIEDELVMSGQKMTTAYMAEQLRAKEKALWTNPQSGEQKAPYLRTCDNNLIVINDLYKLHGISFTPTQKDDAQAALNNMRIMLKDERIIIHPRCKTLILHLQNVTWDKHQRSFARSPDYGHYDAVDALKYFVRNVQFGKNPYPAGYGMMSSDNYWGTPAEKPLSPAMRTLRDMFKPRPSLKRFNK